MKKKIILFSVLAIILLGMILFLFAKIPSPQMDVARHAKSEKRKNAE